MKQKKKNETVKMFRISFGGIVDMKMKVTSEAIDCDLDTQSILSVMQKDIAEKIANSLLKDKDFIRAEIFIKDEK